MGSFSGTSRRMYTRQGAGTLRDSSFRRYDSRPMGMAESPDAALRAALPALLAAHPSVAAILDRSCLLLHGSRTIGMARATSDWDLWVLSDDATHADFAAEHGTRFVDFAADGQVGH